MQWAKPSISTDARSPCCRPITSSPQWVSTSTAAKPAWCFTGDTTINDALWTEVNKIENLRYLIIETAFPNVDKALAIASKHLCPSMLAEELAKLKRPTRVFITHLKPGAGTLTMQEVEEYAERYNPRMLSNGQVFKF